LPRWFDAVSLTASAPDSGVNSFEAEQRLRAMLGFQRFKPAAVTIRSIELAVKIKKRQLNLNRKSKHRSGTLGPGPGRLKSAKPLARQKHTPDKICTGTVLVSDFSV
jgi:hypothetical protein